MCGIKLFKLKTWIFHQNHLPVGAQFKKKKTQKILWHSHYNQKYVPTIPRFKSLIFLVTKITNTQKLKALKTLQKAADMAGAVLKQITKNFHYRDKNTFKKLYIQYVQPHMEFASPVWSPWLENDMQMLENIQRTKLILLDSLLQESLHIKMENGSGVGLIE